MTHFQELGLAEPLLRALRAEQYEQPTPIQAGAIPHLLARRDFLGCAQTGTGKTAAFALPILQLLSSGARAKPRTPRALVLVPTRELALQVSESFTTYGQFLKLSTAVIYGGVGQGPQVRTLTSGVEILVATPGRLLDLMEQKYVHLSGIEFFVLDEVDQMLDLGFIRDIHKILRALPKRRQNVFLSATMPGPIAKLADGILHDPAKVSVTPAATTVELVDQRVHFVDRSRKPDLLRTLLIAPEVERALVFTRTKRGADKVARELGRGGVEAAAIHGNKSQNTRERTLASFRRGKTRVLVATDIAARGIDIDDISHVVNFDLPNVPETYVHRIGRTARAGASGIAISLVDSEERAYLKDIERLIKQSIPVDATHGGDSGESSRGRRSAHADRGGHADNGHRDRSRPARSGGGRPRNDSRGPMPRRSFRDDRRTESAYPARADRSATPARVDRPAAAARSDFGSGVDARLEHNGSDHRRETKHDSVASRPSSPRALAAPDTSRARHAAHPAHGPASVHGASDRSRSNGHSSERQGHSGARASSPHPRASSPHHGAPARRGPHSSDAHAPRRPHENAHAGSTSGSHRGGRGGNRRPDDARPPARRSAGRGRA